MNVVREKQFSASRGGKAKPRLFSFRAQAPSSGMCVQSSAGQRVPIAVTVPVTSSAASWREVSGVPLQHLHQWCRPCCPPDGALPPGSWGIRQVTGVLGASVSPPQPERITGLHAVVRGFNEMTCVHPLVHHLAQSKRSVNQGYSSS